jgi:hypothetical protein
MMKIVVESKEVSMKKRRLSVTEEDVKKIHILITLNQKESLLQMESWYQWGSSHNKSNAKKF